jgi:branched-chain amino acid transport system permease protein
MKNNSSTVVYLVLLAALIVAPFAGAYPVFVMKLMCYALFASAFNLLLGYTGLLSFGHAAFLGGSAYVAGQAMKVWGLTPELGLIAGTLTGALLGWVFGSLAIRRQGIYFAMITLALAQMVFFAALQAKFTGGEDGLQGVPRGRLFGVIDLQNDLTMYYVALVIVVAAFLLIVRTIHSPFGQVLKGIKENEPRALSLGYDVSRFKLLAFVISAALSGLAGSLKTLVLGFATLSDVHWSASGQVILMTLVGGLGTLSGPLVGSAVVVLLENKIGEFGHLLARLTTVEWFDTLGESVTIVTGLIFVVCVLAFRRGVMGEIIALADRRRGAQSVKTAAPARSP